MADRITLRDYRASDLDAIFRLDQICFSEEFRFDRESMRGFAESEGAFCLIAETAEGEVAGFVIVDWDGGSGYVVTLDVAMEWRRRGLATRLMLAAEHRVQGRWMLLHVFTGNAEAVRFYERLGYERVGERRGFYGRPGLDAWVYRKALHQKIPAS